MKKEQIKRVLKHNLFYFIEGEEYKTQFVREVVYDNEKSGNPVHIDIFHLYGVAYVSPFKTEIVYVLAQSEQDALEQSENPFYDGEIYQTFTEREEWNKEHLISVSVKQLPFQIRGYGKTQF